MKFTTLSDDEVVAELCRRIKETRIAQRLSQIELASRAQVGIATIKRVEQGGAVTLTTLIGILRALDRLHQLESVLFDSEVRGFNADLHPSQPRPPQRIRKKTVSIAAPEVPEVNVSAREKETGKKMNEWYATAMENSVVWPVHWPDEKK